jgi:hypothetical protein
VEEAAGEEDTVGDIKVEEVMLLTELVDGTSSRSHDSRNVLLSNDFLSFQGPRAWILNA